ncbi:hypothetical protein [Sinomicrobium pectinilyticum]|uniref:Uncharacterized protein n=1 Tax=Sinomicrobium pectinilyticum TaxID=1084421 RepID=A0A3N0DQN9_SINP1|nr:hypothetical protein [Sinomicrobium pectinilyticum]RNL77942.1 hypothetical protein ED312_20340 [Sinomicrobium pectinilyticum]
MFKIIFKHIGDVLNTTLVVVPSAGYQIRFTASSGDPATVMKDETGGTGTGHVTNVTVNKI